MTSTLRRLLVLAGPPRRRVALTTALGAATVVCGVGLMASAGYLISRAAEHPDVLALMTTIVAVRFFGLARPVFRYLERLASHDLAFRGLSRARVNVYERVEPLAPAELGGYRRGDLLSRFVADVDALQNLHLRGLGPPLVGVVAGTAAVAAAAIVLPAAGVVLALGLVLAAVAVPAAALVGRGSGHGEAEARAELAAELVETLGAAPELVAYGADEDRLRRVRRADRRLVGIARRAAFADGLGDAVRILLTGATVAGVLAAAVSAHAAGRLDRTLIALLGLLALASFEAVQPLAESARRLGETVAAGRRILELVDREPAVADPAEPAPVLAGRPTVAFEDVRARYAPGDSLALDGLTLRLEPGRRVALVGPSGAGKTTAASLLLRFVDPEAGRVTLGGRDLREYSQEDVRRTIAVAGQDSHLFSTSVYENVRLARPDATDEAIEAALRRAKAWSFVRRLPDGWDTLVGEAGRELSGGQRRRIVIARALLADAPVLVLDEPTAHLDAPTAQALMEDVLDAADDRSVLLITHRPEGLDLVDEVVEL